VAVSDCALTYGTNPTHIAVANDAEIQRKDFIRAVL
jgi:hypothetical protein